MDARALLYLLITQTLALCGLVAFAVVAWKRASRSTPRPKPPESQPPTPGSDAAALAALQADQAALFSTLEKLTTTVKRVSSRQGMRDLRERSELPPPPPPGTSKADLLRYYGMSGKVGPAFAQAQLDLEARHGQPERPN